MGHGDAAPVDDAIPSPNIWNDADVYEIENRSVDREGRIEAAMAGIVQAETGRTDDWGHVLDVGCGTGFHLPRWAERATRVTGVEPRPPLVEGARRRVEGLPAATATRVEVRRGGAQALPVDDASVDVVHARWAYFFGPGCQPGLAELDRVVAPGGVAFVVDDDATTSTFGTWFRRAHPDYDPAAIRRFWTRRGWTRHPLLVAWEMDSRADFESVVRIEFAPALAEAILAEHPGTSVDYAVDLWWRTFPGRPAGSA